MSKVFQVDTNGTLTTSLVSCWKFEGNSNDFFGSNNGTDTGTSYSTSYGKVHQGVQFNASSSEKIVIAASASMDVAGSAYSIALWVKFNSLPASGKQMWLFWKGTTNGASPGYALILSNVSGTYYIDVPKFGVADQNIAWTPSTGTWYHLVVIQNYSGSTPTTVSVYVNGSHIGDSTSNSSAYGNTSGYSAYIGGTSTTGSIAYTDAELDELLLYAKALGSQEITDLYNGGAGQTMISSTTQSLTVTATAVPSISRAATYFRTMSASAAGVVSIARAVTRFITMATTATAISTIQKSRTFVMTLSVAAVGSVSLGFQRLTTWLKQLKNASPWTLESRGDSRVWDDIRVLWDDSVAFWDSPRTSFTKETKNVATLNLEQKNP